MPADRPACHCSTNAAWDTSSPYWGETEQARVRRLQTLNVGVKIRCRLFSQPVQFDLFCKWQLVINWHRGSVKTGCVQPGASKELRWDRKRCFFPWTKRWMDAAGWQAESQPAVFFKLTHSTALHVLSYYEKLDPYQNPTNPIQKLFNVLKPVVWLKSCTRPRQHFSSQTSLFPKPFRQI